VGPPKARKYAWSDVPAEQLNPSMLRRMVHGDRILVADMQFRNGFLVPLHQHVNEQVTLVKSGVIRFRLGTDRSQVIDVHPGEVLIIPSNLPHEAEMIGDVAEMDVFTPLREDWLSGTDAYLRGCCGGACRIRLVREKAGRPARRAPLNLRSGHAVLPA